MKCILFLFIFGGHFLWSFFGQVWGKLGKNRSHHQKFAYSHTSGSLAKSKSGDPAGDKSYALMRGS